MPFIIDDNFINISNVIIKKIKMGIIENQRK